MARVKGAMMTRKRRNKILKAAKYSSPFRILFRNNFNRRSHCPYGFKS